MARWQTDSLAMLFFTNLICTIQAWGKGSTALEQAKSTGIKLSDREMMQCGRRLHEAERYVQAALNEGLQEANGWTVESFGLGCSFQDLDAMKVCCRMSFLKLSTSIGVGRCPT